MGKGFVLDGVDDQDLATLFHQAFKRKVSIQPHLFFDSLYTTTCTTTNMVLAHVFDLIAILI